MGLGLFDVWRGCRGPLTTKGIDFSDLLEALLDMPVMGVARGCCWDMTLARFTGWGESSLVRSWKRLLAHGHLIHDSHEQ